MFDKKVTVISDMTEQRNIEEALGKFTEDEYRKLTQLIHGYIKIKGINEMKARVYKNCLVNDNLETELKGVADFASFLNDYLTKRAK